MGTVIVTPGVPETVVVTQDAPATVIVSTPGTQGPRGPAGPAGFVGSILGNFKIDANTVGGEPASGKIRYNNAVQINATNLTINHIDNDGIDVDLFLGLLTQGSAVIVQDLNNSDNFQIWQISSAPVHTGANYWTVPVTLSSSGGQGTTGFANNHQVFFSAFKAAQNDHGLLTGLGDDDHTQYLNNTRGDARYYTQAQVASLLAGYVPFIGAGADLNLGNSQKIINSQDPSSPQDLVTLSYFDNNIPDVSGFVPYIGATASVNLGSRSLTAQTLRLNDPANPGQSVSIIFNGSAFVLRDINGSATDLLVNNLGAFNITANDIQSNSAAIGQINDSFLTASILPDARHLVMPGGDVSVDYGNTALKNYGVEILNWTTGNWYNGTEFTANFMNRQLLGAWSVDELTVYNNLYVGSIYDNTGPALAIDIVNRILSGTWNVGDLTISGTLSTPSLYLPSLNIFDSLQSNYGAIYLQDEEYIFLTGLGNPAAGSFSLLSATSMYSGTFLASASGNAAIPVFSYSLQTNTGMYFPTSTSIGFSTAGVLRFSIYSGAVESAAQMRALGTTAATPAFVGSNNTNTGIFLPGGNVIGFSANGVETARTSATEFLFSQPMRLAAASPTLILEGNVANASNAGTIIHRTPGGSESFTQAFDASANVFTWTYGTVAAMRVDSSSKLLAKQGGTTTLAGVMTTLNSQINSVGNTTTTETTLHTVSTASSVWNGNGESVEVIASGTFAANANGKTIRLKFGAQTLYNSGSLAINGGSWKLTSRIFRTTTTTGVAITTLTITDGAGVSSNYTSSFSFTGFNFLTTNSLLTTGQATSSSDIVENIFQAFWVPVS